ncbi:putative ATP-dependent DNA helicase RecQ [Hypsizygus marmoreus]|uniref:ATP-dependent DNA helicase n=1 Tax=Hypsizygus marmoreus TaxID=39966 RepID=A0A369K6X4_HYPMA|nr:putative ATP-dependent DNA helicase RecQ [Hypsizygus marmoreus]
MEKAHQILNDVFGFSSFRLSQEAVISRLLVNNENALVVFPTGGGKSLTYQVPALCLDGLTLVVSPLIALMKDQVDALANRGVKAANLDSTLNSDQAAFVKQEVLNGSLKMLYVAPERLNNEGFINMMSRVTISLLAVDEAHCISQWGASFRPEYLKIARFAVEHNVERVLCLTATATPTVSDDICKSFFINKEGIFRTPVFRPNLSLNVEVADSLQTKLDRLVPLLKGCTGPTIVYVTLQRHAEEVVNQLRPHGIQAAVYHAGLPNEQRAKVQSDFMESESGIVVCTIAFGMGIDKANIRQIVHLYMPKTLENYSQEVGRAGRDGLPSACVMFLSPPDIPILEGFCRGDTCSEKDLQLWLQEVALREPAKDGTLDFNHYKQGREYDIRPNVLNLCYAQLELDYGYLRAITPFYSVYEINPRSNGWASIAANKSAIAAAIRAHCRPKGAKYEIDVVLAAAATGIDRIDLAKQISNWELDGLIDTKASQVRARYAILKALPKTTEEIKTIAGEMFSRMLKREEEGIEKLRQVIEFATDDDCLAHNLAKYFGDSDAVPDGMCQRCTFCTTGESMEFSGRTTTPVDHAQIQAILRACPERDDPRLLARMAFGITSPRLTLNKWSTANPMFGSMVTMDFNALIAAFDSECKKVGYQKVESSPIPTATKRSYTTYSSGSRGRGSASTRGRGSKRGRY